MNWSTAQKSLPLMLSAILVCAGVPSPLRAAPPNLVPGVWTFIGPAASTSGYGSANMTMDPSNPSVIYIGSDLQGLWKTSDGGSSWARLGDPANIGFPTSGYVDQPIKIAVDPGNPQHLYVTDGVGGSSTLGFWISSDGGATWTVPQGYRDLHLTLDLTAMAVDPTDFNHVIIGAHHSVNPGVIESRDGGVTFTQHPAVPTWPGGSMGLHILYHPASGTGNGDTWLAATDGDGFWRTTNAGATWTEVFAAGGARINVAHGGNRIYYTAAGVLYAGAAGHPVRSFDNGATWEYLNDLPYTYYYSVHGDGTTLYTSQSYPILGGLGNAPIYSSPENNGASWDPYQGGAQVFNNGPATMAYDAVNGIMYGAMWGNGLWALKVVGGVAGDGVAPARPQGLRVR